MRRPSESEHQDAYCKIVSSRRHERDDAHMKSQKYGCINKAYIMTALGNMNVKGENFQRLQPKMKSYRKSVATKGKENQISPGKRPL